MPIEVKNRLREQLVGIGNDVSSDILSEFDDNFFYLP